MILRPCLIHPEGEFYLFEPCQALIIYFKSIDPMNGLSIDEYPCMHIVYSRYTDGNRVWREPEFAGARRRAAGRESVRHIQTAFSDIISLFGMLNSVIDFERER